MRRRPAALRFLPLLLLSAVHPAGAQPAPASPALAVRYHLGDDPDGSKGWANANFDDSSWPVAQRDMWPRPAFYSDGFVWVRFLVLVPNDTAEPLGLRVGSLSHTLIADEVFVNGVGLGSFGRVPPHQYVEGVPRDAVFDLPPRLARPGTVAHVALRIWYPPFVRRAGKFDSAALTFDQSRTLHAEEVVAGQRALLGHVLPIIFNSLIFLIGLAVLLLAFSTRSLDLCLYGAMLATLPWFPLFFGFVDARLMSLSAGQVFLLQVILQTPSMIITVEFIWRINRYSDLWFRGLAYASMALFNLALLAAFVPARPSALVFVGLVGNGIAVQAFSLITIIANLWAIFIKRQRRLIAFAMLLVPVCAAGFHLGDILQGEANLRGEVYFLLAFLGASLFLAAILAHQAWREWRARDALKAEFEAAREVQQVLVPAENPTIPGFAIEAVYKPAGQVGGDFYQIVATSHGGVLAVIGDVSGKGMPAAMTVSLLVGTFRTLAHYTQSPGEILRTMNQRMLARSSGGFTTCLVLRVDADGTLTAANAGHIAPYIAACEADLDNGLPLGLSANSVYSETTLRLAPGEPLTLITDGVVEARNAAGELFGFERTAAISSKAAEDIARAAQHFGQEDDITVLTLQFTPAEVAHA